MHSAIKQVEGQSVDECDVVAVCVAIMMVVSVIDRHPRDKQSRDDRDSAK